MSGDPSENPGRQRRNRQHGQPRARHRQAVRDPDVRRGHGQLHVESAAPARSRNDAYVDPRGEPHGQQRESHVGQALLRTGAPRQPGTRNEAQYRHREGRADEHPATDESH